ncbi:hypothetical protein L3Q82_016494 [Scortum barcoo]|uniref:Uncharacterized protein n=1 Tax=Scortum barcoo TaxID=214431 RepID=A0ACB8X7N7_9TELE|nr:hypothetical protein L3Q82_016494 [Scortum barcoo]
MEVTSLSIRLLMLEFILLGVKVQSSYTPDATFLRITPNRLQHFQLYTISFNCEGSDGFTQLRATRNIKGFDPECDVKRTPTGSSCTVDRAYPGDSGEYWCETEGRDRSNSVNITVTDGPVILEIPAFLILEGDDVTLHCRNKKNFSNLRADFYKDDILMQNSPAEEMTINNVSRSDEGFYKCYISDVGESPRSWLAVRANTISIISPSLHEEPRSNSSDSPRVLILLWVAVTILMLVLVLLVVGFLYIRKCRASSKTQTAASHSDEDNETVSGEEDADSNSVTYAVVITKKRKNKETADAGEYLCLCFKKNHIRRPQAEKDEEESSFEPVYSALTIRQTPQALQSDSGLPSTEVTVNRTAAKDQRSTEQEVIYSPVQKCRLKRFLLFYTAFHIIPTRLQLYEYESVSFICEGFNVSAGWRVRTIKEFVPKCSNGKVTSTVICTIDFALESDSGGYWCEGGGGERSNTVNITVTGGPVILESPALPVMEGDAVTLSCRNKMTTSKLTADFYKDGLLVGSSSTGNMTIGNVSESHDGLYKCHFSGAGESPESRLAVRGKLNRGEGMLIIVFIELTYLSSNSCRHINFQIKKMSKNVLMCKKMFLWQCIDGSVILESPALPVMVGETVTLRCRKKETSADLKADFYKNGHFMVRSDAREMTIHSVSKSDEGLYKCRISGAGESAESWLSIKGEAYPLG